MTRHSHQTGRARRLTVTAIVSACAGLTNAHPLVMRWSDLATQATASSGYEEGLRAHGIAALAAFDAVNVCERRFWSYRPELEDRPDLPPSGACAVPGLMVAAAYTTVLSLMRSSLIDAARTALTDLADAEPDADKREAALAHGQRMALELLLLGVADRADHFAAPLLPPGPGVFGPAPSGRPYSARASTWQPFALRQVAAHQPLPPPAPDSAAAQAELDEVRQLGAQASSQRTADQTTAAVYRITLGMADHAALRRPRLKAHGTSLVDALRTWAMFALVAVDTMVAESTWHWQFQRSRPQQALAGKGVVDWLPLLNTPNGPEYPSGVAIWAGALGTAAGSAASRQRHLVNGGDQQQRPRRCPGTQAPAQFRHPGARRRLEPAVGGCAHPWRRRYWPARRPVHCRGHPRPPVAAPMTPRQRPGQTGSVPPQQHHQRDTPPCPPATF